MNDLSKAWSYSEGDDSITISHGVGRVFLTAQIDDATTMELSFDPDMAMEIADRIRLSAITVRAKGQSPVTYIREHNPDITP